MGMVLTIAIENIILS